MTTLRLSLLRRIFALSILVVLIAAIWMLLAAPLLQSVAPERDERAHAAKLLTGYRKAAAAHPSLEQQVKQLQTQARTLPGLMEGASAALAAAALQARVKGIVEAHGGQLRSAQAIPGPTENGFEEIGVRFDIAISMDALPDLLYAIEAGTPYLTTPKLDIHAPETGLSANRPSGPEMLSVRADVFGFRRAGS